MQKLDKYVKIAEAARILGVAENTLRSWTDSGKMPATRNPVNGYRLFRRKDLEAFLKGVERTIPKQRSKPRAK